MAFDLAQLDRDLEQLDPDLQGRLFIGLRGDPGQARFIGDGGEDAEPVEPVKRTRQRKPDSIKLVKRANAAGLIVKSASVTVDAVVLTFGEAETPGAVIETADELRKLI
jgi:hypothetical protein